MSSLCILLPGGGVRGQGRRCDAEPFQLCALPDMSGEMPASSDTMAGSGRGRRAQIQGNVVAGGQKHREPREDMSHDGAIRPIVAMTVEVTPSDGAVVPTHPGISVTAAVSPAEGSQTFFPRGEPMDSSLSQPGAGRMWNSTSLPSLWECHLAAASYLEAPSWLWIDPHLLTSPNIPPALQMMLRAK